MSERRIEEDPDIRDPARRGFVAIVALFALVAATLGAWRLHNVTVLLAGLGLIAVMVIGSGIIIRSARRDRSTARPTWMLTDQGLERIYPSGERETIRWEQIRHMKWVALYGLILRWEETQGGHPQRCLPFRQEFRWDSVHRQYRANLSVQKDEARRLMSAVQEKTGVAYERVGA
jgi:hypothetical protein